MQNKLLTASAIWLLLAPVAAQADNQTLTIRDNRFIPAELTVPAGEKITLRIKNEDATPAEFESEDLNREKIIAPNSEVTVYIGPLSAGTYRYFDDFHRDAAHGTIIAK